MNSQQARELVTETFPKPFDKARFHQFARELLNGFNEDKGSVMAVPDAFAPHVRSCTRLGTYEAPDGEFADVLIVNTTKPWKLERTRTALRDFVAHKLKRGDSYKEAGLVAFVSPDAGSWRFSFVRMEYSSKRNPKTGKIAAEERLTPARRFSYIVGENESCHTAQSRFLELLQDTANKPSLDEIEEAFSVETVTKEFFEQYKALFLDLKDELDDLAKKNKAVGKEFAVKKVSTADFAKKLMGQIVFLYFLQKKGWLGVSKGGDWGDGPHNFLRQLFNGKFGPHKNFFNDILEPLFYDTLATDRGHDAWCKIFNCRIPFLNGGLFEPLAGYDWQKTEIIIPNSLFSNTEVTNAGDKGTGILDVFDRYNFTVNEAEPLEKEVAIDPEMLGKVFENLLEVKERKSKGSFYTPREIVHYMCQESLINYLDTAVNSRAEAIGTEKRKQAFFGDEKAEQTLITATVRKELIPREDIETFIHSGDQASHYEAARVEGTGYQRKLPKTIEVHARRLDDKLADIAVCDPAIGSGAFPVGMMQEIVRARATLTPYFNDIYERTAYHFKRHAIQNCLYGVDIDPGAVEIAKLRLWLSLVVDEDDVKQIKPLPNLDYKIVTGNSLFSVEKNLFNTDLFNRLEGLKPLYFDATDRKQKEKYRQEIDNLIHDLTNGKEAFDFEIYFSEVFHKNKGFNVVIGNPPYVFGGNKGISRAEKDTYKRLYTSGSNKINLFTLFIERGSQLLQNRATLIYIVPNTLLRVTSYSNTRQFILENLKIDEIVDLDVGIFDEVTASTIVISLINEKAERDWLATVKRGYEDVRPTQVSQVEWTRRGYIFDIFSTGGDRDVFEKLACDSTPLEDLCSRIRFGVVISGNFDKVVSDRKHDRTWKPFLEGDEIGPFCTKYRGRFLHYDPDLLHRSRTPDIFETCKIMIQRITGGDTPLKATLDKDGFYNKESILNLILNREDISYEYVLGLLNSRLVNWFYKCRFTNGSKLTVNLSKEYVGQIPVKIPDNAGQAPIANTVRRILTAKQRDAEANTSALEREIDHLVYKLYSLSPEEIAIVEGNNESKSSKTAFGTSG